MVAPRIVPDRPTPNPVEDQDDEDFNRYAMPVDQSVARVSAGTHEVEVYTFHEAFCPKPRLTRAEQRELAIKQAALRIAAGMELRSLRELAHIIGCSPTAIDNATLRICEKVNMRKFHVSDTTRRKQSEARRKALAR